MYFLAVRISSPFLLARNESLSGGCIIMSILFYLAISYTYVDPNTLNQN